MYGEAELFALKERGKLAEALRQLRFRVGTQREVADFAAWAQRFAVNMEVRVGDGEDIGSIGKLADQVQHGGVAESAGFAERQAGYGAEMVFKLASDRAFDAPVAGIVDARGHFVGQQSAITFEQFDGEDADVIEGFENAARGSFGFALEAVSKMRCGSEREAQDSAAMVIFDQRIKSGFAGAGADGKDGKFAGEFDEFFEDQRSVGDFGFCPFDIFALAKNPLALAVVAEAAGFQDGGQSNAANGVLQIVCGFDDGKFGGWDAEFLEQAFFAATILRGFERLRRWVDGNHFLQKARGFDWNIFEFVSDQREAVREFFQRFEIGVFGGDARGDAADWSLR